MSRYPVDMDSGVANLTKFRGALKGGDAMIRNACHLLGFNVSVKVLYKTEEDHRSDVPLSWLADKELVNDHLGDYNDELSERMEYVAKLVKEVGQEGGEGAEDSEGEDDSQDDEVKGMSQKGGEGSEDSASESGSDDQRPVGGEGGINLIWVTDPNGKTRMDLAYLSYGNEPSMGYAYGELVLVATPTERTKALFTGSTTLPAITETGRHRPATDATVEADENRVSAKDVQ